jgi:hypothetical protein
MCGCLIASDKCYITLPFFLVVCFSQGSSFLLTLTSPCHANEDWYNIFLLEHFPISFHCIKYPLSYFSSLQYCFIIIVLSRK